MWVNMKLPACQGILGLNLTHNDQQAESWPAILTPTATMAKFHQAS
jgi:hypothetical protein